MDEVIENKKSKIPTWARILIALVASTILSILLQVVVFKLLKINFTGLDSIKNFTPIQLLLLEFLMLVSTIITVLILRKYVDKKTFTSIGFTSTGFVKQTTLGFITACVMYLVGTAILYYSNQIQFIAVNFNANTLFFSFLLCIVIALNEEILVRGYILGNLLDKSKSKYIALVISALIFSCMHLLNFNITVLSTINIFLAGIILGAVYIFTRSLWFSISLHLFWNFLQGPILGYHVSGFNFKPLFVQNLIENNFINGGEFGFEGSIVCTIITALLSYVIIRYYINFKTN
jgi:hypothetical protein